MSLNAYGYQRTTTDVDLLVRREGLEAFKKAFLGRGYVEKFPGSKGRRDVTQNVKIARKSPSSSPTRPRRRCVANA